MVIGVLMSVQPAFSSRLNEVQLKGGGLASRIRLRKSSGRAMLSPKAKANTNEP